MFTFVVYLKVLGELLTFNYGRFIPRGCEDMLFSVVTRGRLLGFSK
jgi:hypothetical protein